MAGLKLNLNQPLGAWRQPFSQYGTPSTLWPSVSTVQSVQLPWYNLDPSGMPSKPTGSSMPPPSVWPATSVWPPYIQARQRLARYLYVLMMLLYDQNSYVQQFVSEAGNFTQQLTGRGRILPRGGLPNGRSTP